MNGCSAASASLAFVQRAQVAVAGWTEVRLTHSLDAIWRWLDSVPDAAEPADRVIVSTAVLRVAARILVHHRGDAGGAMDGPLGPRGTDRRRMAAAALWYIRRHYRDPQICLERIADHLDVSRFYLSRVVVACTGHGLPTHVNGLRVLTAAVLLRATALRAKEVADLIGYRRTPQLDRQFRLWLRMTPSEFRGAIAGTPAVAPEVYAALSSTIARRRYASPCEAADSLGLDLGTVLGAFGQPELLGLLGQLRPLGQLGPLGPLGPSAILRS